MLEGSASSTSSATRPSPPLRNAGRSREVFTETLKALASASKGIEVLAECEPRVVFANAKMFFAVKLDRTQMRQCQGGGAGVRTSLTGMDETPISFAMNHEALQTMMSLTRATYEHKT